MLVSPTRLMVIHPSLRPALDFNFLSGNLDSRITFTRASTAMAYNSAGVLTSYAIDAPRFDYDPVTLLPLGLLREEARTNILLRSADMTNAAWGAGAGGLATVASGVAAPDGTTNACTISDANAGAALGLLQTVVVASGTSVYTMSVYAKAGTSSIISVRALISNGGTPVPGEVVVNLATGAAQWRTSNVGTSFTVTNAGGGWWRIASTVTDNSTGNVNVSLELRPAFAATYTPTLSTAATGNAIFWGAQIEVGSFATSYIPTVAASVTRSADFCSVLTSAFPFNALEGTLYAAVTPMGVAGLQTVIYLDDGTNNERMGVRALSGSLAGLVIDGGATQATVTGGTLTTAATKVAMAYKLNDINMSVGGSALTVDTSATLPTVTKLLIGYRFSNSDPLSGWFTRAAYYSSRLPDATLVRLTT